MSSGVLGAPGEEDARSGRCRTPSRRARRACRPPSVSRSAGRSEQRVLRSLCSAAPERVGVTGAQRGHQARSDPRLGQLLAAARSRSHSA